MKDVNLVSGGNVKIPQGATVVLRLTISHLDIHGPKAKKFHRYMKLSRKQGVTLKSGSYKYSWTISRLTILNAVWEGPEAVAVAFRQAIETL